MTPEEHITQAEEHLALAGDGYLEQRPDQAVSQALLAIGHALVAAAVELGVPHAPAQQEGS